MHTIAGSLLLIQTEPITSIALEGTYDVDAHLDCLHRRRKHPDAPDPAKPQRVWVHWVLYNLPPDSTGLGEAVTRDALPAGTEEGLNDWDRTGFGGPCPPIGRHRYFHKLYALDTRLSGLSSPRKAAVEAAMKGHTLAEATLIGTYIKE